MRVSLVGVAVASLAVAATRVEAQVPRCADLPCDTTIRLRIHSPPREIKLRLDSLMRELADEPVGSPDRLRIDKALYGLMTEMADVMPLGMIEARTLVDGGQLSNAVRPKGWIGISMDAAPHQEIVSDSGLIIRYYEHPAIISVDPDSPAERSGIARGDLVLAFNGADVTQRMINLTALLQPKQQVTVRVRRGDDVREFGVLVGKAPEGFQSQGADAPREKRLFLFPPGFDGVFQPAVVGANSVFGAELSSVDAESGRAYGVQSGLLVNSVPEGTPARESGLRGGDVIVRAAGQPVVSLAQFRAILRRHLAERALPVEVERDRKLLPLTLAWSAR